MGRTTATRVMAASGSARVRATVKPSNVTTPVTPIAASRLVPTRPRRPSTSSAPPSPSPYVVAITQNQSSVGFGCVEKSAIAMRGGRPPQRR